MRRSRTDAHPRRGLSAEPSTHLHRIAPVERRGGSTIDSAEWISRAESRRCPFDVLPHDVLQMPRGASESFFGGYAPFRVDCVEVWPSPEQLHFEFEGEWTSKGFEILSGGCLTSVDLKKFWSNDSSKSDVGWQLTSVGSVPDAGSELLVRTKKTCVLRRPNEKMLRYI